MDYEEKIPDFVDPLIDIKRTAKFISTSLAGLGLETLLLILLVEAANAPLILGKIIGAEASIAAMFLLNNRYTYTSNGEKTLQRFFKSNAVRAGGILISIIVLKAGVHYGIWYPVANILGVFVGFGFNYGLETVYTWKEHRK